MTRKFGELKPQIIDRLTKVPRDPVSKIAEDLGCHRNTVYYAANVLGMKLLRPHVRPRTKPTERVLALVAEAEKLVAQGSKVLPACRAVGLSSTTYYRRTSRPQG